MQSENFDDIAFVLNITSHLEDVLTFFFRYFMSPFFFPEVVSLNEKPVKKNIKIRIILVGGIDNLKTNFKKWLRFCLGLGISVCQSFIKVITCILRFLIQLKNTWKLIEIDNFIPQVLSNYKWITQVQSKLLVWISGFGLFLTASLLQ